MKTEFSEENIVIRPYCEADIPFHFAAARESIPAMHPWMPWCHANYTVEESATWIYSRAAEWERNEHYGFAIADAHSNHFLGGVGINFINGVHKFANLGYWVRSSHAGKGIATTAARLVSRFAFEELDLNRLEIVVALGNTASERVAEKTGATRGGILRGRVCLYDKPHDATIFSLVKWDSKPWRAKPEV
ncbi:MAG: GNAT family N-acetyltransferase [Verrucomicrobiota bacterium]